MITTVGSHQPLLGTVCEVRISGHDRETCHAGEAEAVAELVRCERIYTAHNPTSELCRWRRGAVAEPSADLGELLVLGLRWQSRTGGLFNAAVGAISELWKTAAQRGIAPEAAEIQRVTAAIALPAYLAEYPFRPHPWAEFVNFNALAKGLAVDKAARAALAVGGVESVTISAGGDLAHRGIGTLRVGIEDPERPYDNAVPSVVVALHGDVALATSGGARRGFRVAGRWYSHVIDPRTGQPVDHVASASVIAPDAASADALATLACVTDPDETNAILATVAPDAACFLVTRSGGRVSNGRWNDHVVDLGREVTR